MSERTYSRRDFLRLSGLTAANTILPRTRHPHTPDSFSGLPPEIHHHSFPQIKSSDFREDDIRLCNSSGPLALASTLIKNQVIENNPDSIKGVVFRGLSRQNWQASGTDLKSLKDLANSYGADYQTRQISTPDQLHQLSVQSPAPLLLQHQPENSQYTYTHLVAGTDLLHDKLTLYCPTSGKPFQEISLNQYFQSQTTPPSVLIPGSQSIPLLDTDQLPLFLVPQVLAWRQEIVKSIPSGYSRSVTGIIIQFESMGTPDLTSTAGAMGLMQVMPFHFQNKENPFDPKTNIQTGYRVFADYLRESFDQKPSIKEALIQAATRYSGGSRQYGLDFYAFFTKNHQGIDNWYRTRSGN